MNDGQVLCIIVNCRERYPLCGFVGTNALVIACCVVRITDELSELYVVIVRTNNSNVYK